MSQAWCWMVCVHVCVHMCMHLCPHVCVSAHTCEQMRLCVHSLNYY